jgi:Caspase domain
MLRYLSVVLIVSVSLSVNAQKVEHPNRDGTLHLFSFGVGAPIEGPPVDDLYGRDAGFIVEAVKRSPAAWKRVETRFVSGLECTSDRLLSELNRLVKDAKPGDLVFVHASTHGTTEDGLLRLDSEKEKVIDANVISASLAKLPCPSLVTIDACQAGGAVRSDLPKQSAWLLGCSETQSTSGQIDDPKVPHGFLILALCEALRGDADSDRDGLVTIGELFKWVPPRATDLARGECEQEAVVVLPDDLAKLPLTRVLPGKHEPLWTSK